MSKQSLRSREISSPILRKATNRQLTSDLGDNIPVAALDQITIQQPQNIYQQQQQGNYQQQQQQLQQQQVAYQEQEDIYHQQQQEIDKLNHKVSKPESEEQLAVDKFQIKYASPDNMLTLTHSINATNMDGYNNSSQNTTPNLARNSVNNTPPQGSVSAFSDSSSDVSESTAKLNHPLLSLPVVEGITEHDVQQVEHFYRSQKTDIRVCQSLVNMYVSASKQKSKLLDIHDTGSEPDANDLNMSDWEFARTGVPLLLLNTGQHIRERGLRLVLAEKGTGFTLWEDTLSHLTRYRTPHENFHTLTLSTDSSRLVGFSFDEARAASQFAEWVRTLTADPDDDALNLSKKKGKKKEKKSKTKTKYKPPRKVDISQPCCFVHVTKLERPETIGVLPESFPPPPSGAELAQMAFTRSQSESSELSECSGATTPSDDL